MTVSRDRHPSLLLRWTTTSVAALLALACDKSTGVADKGDLTIVVSGVGAASPSVHVTGANFDTTITSTVTLTLAPGNYTIAAPDIAGATTRYSAAPTQIAEVAAGYARTAGVRYSALPVSGTHVPGLDPFDSTMIAFMAARNIRAGTLTVSVGTTVRYSRAFGWKDAGQTQPLSPDAMFRLASVSKPVTAAAVRRLISEGKFFLGTSVFEYLALTPAGTVADPRIYSITVNHLLDHEGGWDRETAGDFVFSPRAIAAEMGLSTPPTKTQVAQWAMTKPLQFAPGSRYAYSNFGYSLLGLMIEKASGQSYVDYVKQNIFQAAAAMSVISGRSLPADRDSREPFYADPASGCSVFMVSSCSSVAYPDGAMHLEAFDSFGGLVASAPAMASFLANYWISGQSRLGSGFTYYFFGSMPGTFTLARQRLDGVNIVLLFNQRADGSGLSYEQILTDLDLATVRSSWVF